MWPFTFTYLFIDSLVNVNLFYYTYQSGAFNIFYEWQTESNTSSFRKPEMDADDSSGLW